MTLPMRSSHRSTIRTLALVASLGLASFGHAQSLNQIPDPGWHAIQSESDSNCSLGGAFHRTGAGGLPDTSHIHVLPLSVGLAAGSETSAFAWRNAGIDSVTVSFELGVTEARALRECVGRVFPTTPVETLRPAGADLFFLPGDGRWTIDLQGGEVLDLFGGTRWITLTLSGRGLHRELLSNPSRIFFREFVRGVTSWRLPTLTGEIVTVRNAFKLPEATEESLLTAVIDAVRATK